MRAGRTTSEIQAVVEHNVKIIIKDIIIIIIRTFPESFSQENFPIPNNFV